MATTDENIEKAQNMFLDDRPLKVYEIVYALGLRDQMVWYILHEELTTGKVVAAFDIC